MANFQKLRSMMKKISLLESSGGKDVDHPEIESGLQAGQTAIGQYGILPNTVREQVQSLRNRGAPVPDEIQNVEDMSDDDIRNALSSNKKTENYIAGDLMARILNRTQGDEDKAAYMWNTGHNLDPDSITPATLNENPYVKKYRKLRGSDGRL